MKVDLKRDAISTLSIEDVKQGETFVENNEVYMKTQNGAVLLRNGKHYVLKYTTVWGRIELLKCESPVTFIVIK